MRDYQLCYTIVLHQQHRWLSPAALDLAAELLSYDPAQRITAVQAMEAAYFRHEDPLATLPVGCVFIDMVAFSGCSL